MAVVSLSLAVLVVTGCAGETTSDAIAPAADPPEGDSVVAEVPVERRLPGALLNGFVLTSATNYRSDGTATAVTTYDYDRTTRTISQTTRSPANDQFFGHTRHRYDERGRVVGSAAESEDGVVLTRRSYEYEDELLTVETVVPSAMTRSLSVVRRYDASGRIIARESSVFEGDVAGATQYTRWRRDDDGRLVAIGRDLSPGFDGLSADRYDVVVDEQGLIEAYLATDSLGRVDFVRDTNGNVVESRHVDAEGRAFVRIVRTYAPTPDPIANLFNAELLFDAPTF